MNATVSTETSKKIYPVQWVATLGFVFIAGLVCQRLELKLSSYRQSISVDLKNTESPTQKINPDLFRIVARDLLPAALDWVWITAHLDPSNESVRPGEHPPLYYAIDLVTDLDQANYGVYPASANYLAVIRNDGQGALSLLLKGDRFRREGLPRYPEEFRRTVWRREWDISVLMGYVYLFELENLPSASLAFQEAAKNPLAPAYVHSLSRRLKTPLGQYEVGLMLIGALAEGAQDVVLREELIKKRDNLNKATFIATLNYRMKLVGSFKKLQITHDPWGGALSVGKDGRIQTTTPFQSVFGLDGK